MTLIIFCNVCHHFCNTDCHESSPFTQFSISIFSSFIKILLRKGRTKENLSINREKSTNKLNLLNSNQFPFQQCQKCPFVTRVWVCISCWSMSSENYVRKSNCIAADIDLTNFQFSSTSKFMKIVILLTFFPHRVKNALEVWNLMKIYSNFLLSSS